MVRAGCPHCLRDFNAPEKLLGKQTRCPACKQTFTVVADSSLPSAVVEDDPPDDPPPPRRSRPSASRDERHSERDEYDDDREERRPSRRSLRDDQVADRHGLRERGGPKPNAVQTAGVLMLLGGISAILVAFTVMFFSSLTIVCCLYPGWLYALVTGILAIVRGSFLLGANAYKGTPGRWAAIMLIVCILNFDPISCILGIVSLVLLNQGAVTRYFGE